MNYNDLTQPHPKWWFTWGIAPQPPYLVHLVWFFEQLARPPFGTTDGPNPRRSAPVGIVNTLGLDVEPPASISICLRFFPLLVLKLESISILEIFSRKPACSNWISATHSITAQHPPTAGVTQVLVFASICQGVILEHVFDPQLNDRWVEPCDGA